MSDESDHVLEVVRDELQKRGADIVGRLELSANTLTAFNGQMLLQAEIRSDPGSHPSIAHCHIVARIGNSSLSGPLDACVTGIDPDRRQALAKAAQNWVTNVGSVLFSLLHARPVMDAAHFDGSDPWGVPGCHGFVGPLYGYGMDQPAELDSIQNAALFDCAAAMAPSGIVHLAKVVLQAKGSDGWTRTIEVDGHAASFQERSWNCALPAPPAGIAGQFAVFHFADQKDAVDSRRRLDEAIRQFVSETTARKDVAAAQQTLMNSGADPDLIHRVALFVPLACFRVAFDDFGVTFPTEYHRITKTGTAETRKLMREPAFARAVALCPELFTNGLADGVKTLATYSPMFHALNNALNAGGKPENLVMLPPVVPDHDADAAAIDQALKSLEACDDPPATSTQAPRRTPTRPPVQARKPWWRFW